MAETGNFSMSDSLKSDPDATSKWTEGAIDPSQTFVYVPSDADQHRFTIPGYELISVLGRGGMGVVYKARQIRADRIVALKVMINIDHARPEEIERFTVEAQSSARLHHPNIAQVYEVGQSDQSPYFTQEFVSGGTLSRKIAKQMLGHAEVAKVMHTLAVAVAYAHSRKIVHRDLKPLNILLDENGSPKIADFGLARRMEDQSHLTQDGYLALLEKSGYRYGFRQNLVGSANEYGDYLLKTHADPEKIEQQYRLAMDSLHTMVQTPEMISLEQNGLAIGYYRLGLACLRGGKDQDAESHFLHSAVLREKAYRDALESLGSGSTTDAVLPQRIDWLLTQARSGTVADVTKTVEELGKRAMSEAPIQSVVSKSDIFLQCSAALGILAQTKSVRENPASSEKFQSHAIKSLGKAIDAGYRDINYLKSDADFEWLSQSDSMKPIENKVLALAASVPPPN